MKQWYVIQVFAGSEERVKADIEKRIQEEQLQDFFGQVLVPSAKTKPSFVVVDEKDQQLFPGYVLVEAAMGPEVMRLVAATPPQCFVFWVAKNQFRSLKKKSIVWLSQVTGEITVAAAES